MLTHCHDKMFDYKKAWQDLRSQTTEAVCELSQFDGRVYGELPIRGTDDFERLRNLVDDYGHLLDEINKHRSFTYRIQITPDAMASMPDVKIVIPLKTLKDSSGNIAHIIKDNEDYVLIRNTDGDGLFSKTFFQTVYWFPEAAAALKSLP